jgi:hypothetical protein
VEDFSADHFIEKSGVLGGIIEVKLSCSERERMVEEDSETRLLIDGLKGAAPLEPDGNIDWRKVVDAAGGGNIGAWLIAESLEVIRADNEADVAELPGGDALGWICRKQAKESEREGKH